MRRRFKDRYLNAVDSEVLAYSMIERVKKDVQNIQRAVISRKNVVAQGCEDRRELVKTLLSIEALDITRRELETLGDSVDELYGKIRFHDVMFELELSYSFRWMEARKRGYKKQLATFIQTSQSYNDGLTSDGYDVWANAWHDETITCQELEEGLDYARLFSTFNDYRWDDEHSR